MSDKKSFTCIRCPRGCRLTAERLDDRVSVSGNLCPRGRVYGEQEFCEPKRMVTSLVKVVGGDKPVLPVKTTEPVIKSVVKAVLDKIMIIRINAPVSAGDVVMKDIVEGVDLVATSDVLKISG